MPKARIDTEALWAALNAEREHRGVSWRELARQIDVSPSLLSRIGNGYRPDADGFVTLVAFLGLSTDDFVRAADDEGPGPPGDAAAGGGAGQDGAGRREPELMTQLAPLLRARKDLTPADVQYLEDVIAATVRRTGAARAAEQQIGERQTGEP